MTIELNGEERAVAPGTTVRALLEALDAATPIDLGATVPQTVTGSTLSQIDLNAPFCSFSNAPDTVYAFTAPAAGRFFFDTLGSSYNTVLHVHSPTCTGAEIACTSTPPMLGPAT